MPITPTNGTTPPPSQGSSPPPAGPGTVSPGISAADPPARPEVSSHELVAAGDRLRALAARPMLAIGQWKRLPAAQQNSVVTTMTRRYGADFAHDFLSYARGDKKPNLSTEVTNTETPATLTARGFKLAGDSGGIQVWVHPSGCEVWLSSSGKDAPSAPSPARAAPTPPVADHAPINPNIQEAHDWAEDFDGRFDALQDELTKLKALENPKGAFPAGPFNAYCEKLSRFERDLSSVLDDEVPLWRDSPLSAEEKDALENQIARIKSVAEHSSELEL